MTVSVCKTPVCVLVVCTCMCDFPEDRSGEWMDTQHVKEMYPVSCCWMRHKGALCLWGRDFPTNLVRPLTNYWDQAEVGGPQEPCAHRKQPWAWVWIWDRSYGCPAPPHSVIWPSVLCSQI